MEKYVLQKETIVHEVWPNTLSILSMYHTFSHAANCSPDLLKFADFLWSISSSIILFYGFFLIIPTPYFEIRTQRFFEKYSLLSYRVVRYQCQRKTLLQNFENCQQTQDQTYVPHQDWEFLDSKPLYGNTLAVQLHFFLFNLFNLYVSHT